MPEGRLIKRKIADNERLNSLPVPARLLYDRLILFVDREARHHANPRLLLRRFFPLDDYTDEEMQGWLEGLHKAKKNGVSLLELYEVDNIQYLWLPGFEQEQSKSWSHPTHGTKWKEAESSIPPPPEKTRPRLKPLTDIILTPFEVEVLDVIKTIPGWEFDEAEDTAWIRSLSEDFTNLTIENIKACRDYHSDSDKPDKKGPWKNRLRNWLKNDLEFGKERKSGADRKNPRQLRDRKNYTDPDQL